MRKLTGARVVSVCLTIVSSAYGSVASAQAVPPEFQVNTHTNAYQYDSALAALTGGGFIVVWHDSDSAGVSAQRFTSDAAKSGNEISGLADGTLALTDPGPDVAGLAGGGAVVVWSGAEDPGTDAASEKGVAGQRLAANGAKSGTVFHVNTTTAGIQTLGGVAALDGGGFVVTWDSTPVSGGVGQDGSGFGVYARRYDDDGSPAGGEFRVNVTTAGDQKQPTIAALADGGFVVVWIDNGQSGLFARRYLANGSAVGSEFRVKPFGTGLSLDVAGLNDGGFVVAWHEATDGVGTGVFARRFDAGDVALGVAFIVNTYTANGQLWAASAGLSNGGYVITWVSDGQDGSGLGVYGQKFSSDGVRDGDEFLINAKTVGGQSAPAVSAVGDGFVTTWTSDQQDGSDYGVYGRSYGGPAPNIINGDSGPNNLTGTVGNDIIDGKGGADVMTGLAGNDIYYVRDPGDTVVEVASGGNDVVRSSIAYTLPAHVENLTLTGAAAINGTGNGLGNTLIGNNANNVLDGKAGADGMTGKAGNDTYYVDHAGDQVTESVGQGTDTVRSSVTHTLAANVENLVLTGNSAINGTGNAIGNKLTGNTGANLLNGLGGNDVLSGGSGNDQLNGGPGTDTLTGGTGQDRLLFSAALAPSNIDKVTDFSATDDTIRLENSVFTALTSPGVLAPTRFKVGTAATTGAHRIIYDQATGYLYYDRDGTGAVAKIHFATLTKKPAITHADFVVQ
jgi:hypothetical protein